MTQYRLALNISLLLLAGCQAAPPVKPVHAPGPQPAKAAVNTKVLPTSVGEAAAAEPGESRPAPAAIPPAPMIMRPSAPAANVKKLADGHDMPAVTGLLASAETRLQQGRLDEASTSLERAQRLAPQSAAVYLKLAETRFRQGRMLEAEQLARKGLAFSRSATQQAALWRMISMAADRQGKADAAQQARQKAEQLEAQGDRG